MMRLKVDPIGNGLHPSEVVVAIQTAEGVQRLVISRKSIVDNAIEIGWPIGEQPDKILVELPRETQTGAWRVWVPRNQVVEFERMRA